MGEKQDPSLGRSTWWLWGRLSLQNKFPPSPSTKAPIYRSTPPTLINLHGLLESQPHPCFTSKGTGSARHCFSKVPQPIRG